MESADLGIARWDESRNAIAVMFGDNFEHWRLQGEWQSPSIVMYDRDFNVLGVPIVGGIASNGRRRQLWDYPHNNPEYTTILPCDFIKIGDWWYVAAMVTRGLGNELRTVFWQSRDLVDWQKTDPYLALNHPGHPGNVMLTFDRIADWVYIFGAGGLRRDRGIWMWRNKASKFPHGWWEPWGRNGQRWGWGIPNEGTPILQGRYGELCFRYLQGNCVLSFFDAGAYRQTALTVASPDHDWTRANRVDYAFGHDFPQLYGGYLSPTSRLNERDGMKFLVSQWNTMTNDPYHVVLFTDTLHAQGPLRPDVLPPKLPGREAPPEKEQALTPQELYETLLRELAASASTEIVNRQGKQLTLRQAVAEISVKEQL